MNMATERPGKANIDLIVIPKSCAEAVSWASLVQKAKDFRLNSLQESPEAFGSSYGREIAFTEDVWADRLTNPQATSIVAVHRKEHLDANADDVVKVRALLENTWAATTTLIQIDDWGYPSNLHPDATRASDSLLFRLNGVYVAPSYRAQGIGKATIADSLVVGRAMASSLGVTARFQVRVDKPNIAAKTLYERAGFRVFQEEEAVLEGLMKDGVMLPGRETTVLVMEHAGEP
jgi:ribosomal protein S18 acetylase RimI-like enzyme